MTSLRAAGHPAAGWSLGVRVNKGGSPSPPKEPDIPKPEKLPPPPKPPPPLPPPPTETSADIEASRQDQRAQELRRRGLAGTLLAGETGGANSTGRKTLLG